MENLNVPGGIPFSKSTIKKISHANDFYDLFEVLCCCKPYWNWMNIRIIEKLAGDSLEAKQLINEYRNEIFSRKVKDVMLEIINLEVPIDKYTEVKEKLNKEFGDLVIKDIVDQWMEIERKFNVGESMLLKSITPGCVEICWLLPDHLVEHAVYSATNNQQGKHDDQSGTGTQELFPEVLYLQIGVHVIKDAITSKIDMCCLQFKMYG